MKQWAVRTAVTTEKTRLKFINIVEELDIPVPRAVAYQAWTKFENSPVS